jgi:hypothetical protein
VRVQGRAPRGGVFVLREQLLQLRVFFAPFFVVFIERLRQTAPTDIFREDLLFIGSRRPVFVLNLFQSLYGLGVAPIFLFLTAFSKIVVGDAEVLFGNFKSLNVYRLIFCVVFFRSLLNTGRRNCPEKYPPLAFLGYCFKLDRKSVV